MPRAAKKTGEPKGGQADSLTLSDVRQVKVLADPLRIRILEELSTAERTTKQVAERLGEKPTKLYHHVEALERVGLIRLARTRQKRGTLEKYYIAVARQFRTDSRLFSAAKARSGPGPERQTCRSGLRLTPSSVRVSISSAAMTAVRATGEANGRGDATGDNFAALKPSCSPGARARFRPRRVAGRARPGRIRA